VRRWEYRIEAFAHGNASEDEKRAPWQRYRPTAASEQDWLNSLGAEGWELVAISETHVYGKTGGGTVLPDGHFAEWQGAIPAKQWTFRREVPL
jgi:hypothetical protein